MITASLVTGADPRLVQIKIDETPAGEAWRVLGRLGSFTPGLTPSDDLLPADDLLPEDATFTPSGYEWQVPGGFGIGDGEPVGLVDNRAPGNGHVVYRLVTSSGEDAAQPLLIRFPKDVVLQSWDGQQTVSADLLAGSDLFELPTNVAAFRVPGRARPVTRFDVVGDVVSTMNVLLPIEETTPFKALLGPGRPIICRFGRDIVDLDRVAVLQITRISSPRVLQSKGLRVWSLDYMVVDDPWLDIRLGAYTWADFAAAFEGRPWSDFTEAFAGKTWADFATADWSEV